MLRLWNDATVKRLKYIFYHSDDTKSFLDAKIATGGELQKYQLRTPSKGFAYPCWANSRTDWKGIKIMRGRIKGMGNRHRFFHYSNRQKAHVWKWRCRLRITQKVGCHESPLMAISFLCFTSVELREFCFLWHLKQKYLPHLRNIQCFHFAITFWWEKEKVHGFPGVEYGFSETYSCQNREVHLDEDSGVYKYKIAINCFDVEYCHLFLSIWLRDAVLFPHLVWHFP